MDGQAARSATVEPASFVPQVSQKELPAAFSVPQFEHFTDEATDTVAVDSVDVSSLVF